MNAAQGNGTLSHLPVSRLPWSMVVQETWAGKSLARTLMNYQVSIGVSLSGVTLDLGAGRGPSYWRFVTRPERLITADIDLPSQPSVVCSLEEPLPFQGGVCDCVIIFNVLEHVYRAKELVQEAGRVLRRDGHLYLSVPFLVSVHEHTEEYDFHDFHRFTQSALRRMLTEAGFAQIRIAGYGGYFAVLTEHLNRLVPWRIWRAATVLVGLFLDVSLGRLVRRWRRDDRYALGFFVDAVRL